MGSKDGRVPEAPGASPSGTGAQEVSAHSGDAPSRDDTDWHVLAQDIANRWVVPEERAVAYLAAGEAIKLLRAEMEGATGTKASTHKDIVI